MFDHEKLDVYQASVEFAGWAFGIAAGLAPAHRAARDQILRASQSIALNIAEGNGKRPGPDRARFLHIAAGSALECAAILDVLAVCGGLAEADREDGKRSLARIVAMLVKMASAVSAVREDEGEHYAT